MTPAPRTREDSESGVVLIIFAIAMVVLLGMIAIAIDGSYGFVQNRRAQNATDFAAFAAAQQLYSSTYCAGSNDPSTQQITAIVQKLVDENSPGIGTGWTAQFLNSQGQAIGSFSPSSDAADPPPGACGVTVSAKPSWTPFFAGIFGIHQLNGYASGSVGNTRKGNPIGIVALNEAGPHEVLGGGTGTFVVSGSIFLNTDVTKQPWTGSAVDPTTQVAWEWDDAIDAKTDSNLYVYGPIDTVKGTYNGESLWPLDTCFQPNVKETGTNSYTYASGDPAAQLPGVQMACSEWGGAVTIDYNSINPTFSQITDPLVSSGAPPSPMSLAQNVCPGSTGGTPIQSYAPGQTVLSPGDYPNPVEITGNATFEDCPGGYPGVFRFDQGLWINPGANDTVSGTNVVITTGAPYPVAGNVPGSTDSQGAFTPTAGSDGGELGGNGAPCLPSSTMTSAASGHGTPENETSSAACAGTNPTTYGVVAYGDTTFVPDTSMSGTGNNFSVMIGGTATSTVNLAGPTTGPYAGEDGSPGIVLYQDPGTQANFGFNAEAGDAAAIDLTGVVYNASLANYGYSAPTDYWDGVGGGIPFYAGGTLQTGFGAGWTSATGPTPSSGSVTIDGTAIVDDFNTDGNTNITILGEPYKVPGTSSLSLIG